ncbi:hypothetical protein I5E68_09695 [Novosphingobium sp. YJ-S2-02]|uniref:Uncharacterized protein n=1 Tax=Novosphingobium aureum TaxID=2792964 RepID=A0A931HD17_9SPHN|nr:hypothetical protein [Novosphingobium aureum]MBH0113218.1 hypothetical protein [Novosphingobium aureum]
MTTTPPCPWQPGDRVQRAEPRSYRFPGVVIAVGLKLDGKTWHCEVECIAPGCEGMTHVFPASRLEALGPDWDLPRQRFDAPFTPDTSSYHIAWSGDRAVGVICADRQMAYELRKGAHNTLGIVTDEFVEAWADMTCDDNCTMQTVQIAEGSDG